MTDTHKDLVKELLLHNCLMEERGLNMPVLRKAASAIERLTASAPVDGDLRQAEAVERMAHFLFRKKHTSEYVESHSWESHFDSYKDAVRQEALDLLTGANILALLPARTPETDADVVERAAKYLAPHIVVDGITLEWPHEYKPEIQRVVRSVAHGVLAAANLLRQSAPVEAKPNPHAGWKVPPYYNGEHDQGMGVTEKCKCGNALRLKPLGWECEKCRCNYGR